MVQGMVGRLVWLDRRLAEEDGMSWMGGSRMGEGGLEVEKVPAQHGSMRRGRKYLPYLGTYLTLTYLTNQTLPTC